MARLRTSGFSSAQRATSRTATATATAPTQPQKCAAEDDRREWRDDVQKIESELVALARSCRRAPKKVEDRHALLEKYRDLWQQSVTGPHATRSTIEAYISMKRGDDDINALEGQLTGFLRQRKQTRAGQVRKLFNECTALFDATFCQSTCAGNIGEEWTELKMWAILGDAGCFNKTFLEALIDLVKSTDGRLSWEAIFSILMELRNVRRRGLTVGRQAKKHGKTGWGRKTSTKAEWRACEVTWMKVWVSKTGKDVATQWTVFLQELRAYGSEALPPECFEDKEGEEGEAAEGKECEEAAEDKEDQEGEAAEDEEGQEGDAAEDNECQEGQGAEDNECQEAAAAEGQEDFWKDREDDSNASEWEPERARGHPHEAGNDESPTSSFLRSPAGSPSFFRDTPTRLSNAAPPPPFPTPFQTHAPDDPVSSESSRHGYNPDDDDFAGLQPHASPPATPSKSMASTNLSTISETCNGNKRPADDDTAHGLAKRAKTQDAADHNMSMRMLRPGAIDVWLRTCAANVPDFHLVLPSAADRSSDLATIAGSAKWCVVVGAVAPPAITPREGGTPDDTLVGVIFMKQYDYGDRKLLIQAYIPRRNDSPPVAVLWQQLLARLHLFVDFTAHTNILQSITPVEEAFTHSSKHLTVDIRAPLLSEIPLDVAISAVASRYCIERRQLQEEMSLVPSLWVYAIGLATDDNTDDTPYTPPPDVRLPDVPKLVQGVNAIANTSGPAPRRSDFGVPSVVVNHLKQKVNVLKDARGQAKLRLDNCLVIANILEVLLTRREHEDTNEEAQLREDLAWALREIDRLELLQTRERRDELLLQSARELADTSRARLERFDAMAGICTRDRLAKSFDSMEVLAGHYAMRKREYKRAERNSEQNLQAADC
ncbi:hypothetical protein AC578_4840 [Pseudocercospora eumusae]|uniref:Uncharacterized protein n=1 Tax=Pseudocercospora eumusae TaxID=321146 RepID=A0A139GUI7_9PEZI|nr:hypothetical protein AC578_4840 [Pseudocercospora eumusae]